MNRRALYAYVVALAALLSSVGAHAEGTAADAEAERVVEAARNAAVAGPSDIALADQASLKLPQGASFIPKTQASALMHVMGNVTGPDFLGMIYVEGISGFFTLDFEKSGYIKDGDAKEWNADELLKNLKEGTEAGNEDRRARQIPEFEVTGWVEPPHYDGGTHRLVWSAALRDKHPAAGAVQGVNYNTYLLGREGYVSLNLVSDLDKVDAGKPVAKGLLAAIEFKDGKRYADFNSSTDKVAEYGLAALVGGLAAKKLGLLATLGVMLAKFWKLGLLALAGAGAGIRKFFRKSDA